MYHRFLAISICALACTVAFAQKPGGGGGAGTSGGGRPGSTGGAGAPGSPTTTRNPNSFPSTNRGYDTSGPYGERSIFLYGVVMFDDGSKASSDIRIERVCNGSPRLEGHTDSKGRFSFQLGQNMGVDPDASEEQTGNFGRPNGRPVSSMGSDLGRSGTNALWNCELRATYPGYRSDVVSLATRRSMDDPNVGTIVLHRLANVQGSTLSVTTALAPKHAQKEYEKGLKLAQQGRLEEAEKHLVEATDAYSKYAVAWYELGQVQEGARKTENARKSYQAAISADGRYVSPYDHLALLSVREGKWDDAASLSKQVIQLNPVEFPSSYFYNAVANYNLKKVDEAEKSAKGVLKLDTGHKYPQAEGLLAQILIQKANYSEAATHLRAYLTLVPNAKNADALKQQLQKLEQASAEVKK
ncbi:MAG: tetratricopeptide repeat protein [Bryobacteraceae bacterium]